MTARWRPERADVAERVASDGWSRSTFGASSGFLGTAAIGRSSTRTAGPDGRRHSPFRVE